MALLPCRRRERERGGGEPASGVRLSGAPARRASQLKVRFLRSDSDTAGRRLVNGIQKCS